MSKANARTIYSHSVVRIYLLKALYFVALIVNSQAPLVVSAATVPVYRLYGINFSPYIDGQDPNLGSVVDEAQIIDRLSLISSDTEWIRTYGSTSGLENTGRIAKSMGLKTAIGAWLDSDSSTNNIEIQNVINAANAGEADIVIVGSEVFLRGDLTESQLIGYIETVRNNIPSTVPIAYADSYEQWIAHPAVIDKVDIILANYYPYWDGIDVHLAVAALHGWHQLIIDKAGGKEVIVGETGWPSAGDPIGDAIPSADNASFYFLNFISWARANNVPYFYFEAFDEQWKANYEGTQGAHWGVWDKSGVLKPGMEAVFDGQTIPDNWSDVPIPGGPGDPTIEYTYIPPLNSDKNLQGQVLHVNPRDYSVAVYIYVGGWWTKPTFASPLTVIKPDGTWETDITTGGIDEKATQIAAFLVPNDYIPPALSGQATLPAELSANAVASISVTRTSTYPPPELTSLTITPSAAEIELGTSLQFTAMGTFTDGSTQDVTSVVNWTSDNTDVVTIGNSATYKGLAAGISTGTVTISVTDTVDGISATASANVITIDLVSIIVSPDDTKISVGQSRHMYAIGLYSNNSFKDISDDVQWQSNDISVASMSNGINKGVITGVASGATNISVTDPLTNITSSTHIFVGNAEKIILQEDFYDQTSGLWSADNGLWEIGAPSVGPQRCHSGLQCAGTVLNGNYSANTSSRFISKSVLLPSILDNEEIHLRFYQWFSLAALDAGYVQVSVWDGQQASWGPWTSVGESIADASHAWSLKDVDLTPYANQKIRIAFYHTASRDCCNASESSGWYLDDIQVVIKPPLFSGDFETGIDDWSADRGLWQVGSPSAGPQGCYQGDTCAGTIIDGNYSANTDSRFISPSVVLPAIDGTKEIHFSFYQWFSLAAYDVGYVQISVWDDTLKQWQDWKTIGSSIQNVSRVWSRKDVEVTEYANQKVRFAFYHTAKRDCCNASESSGWYIDAVSIDAKTPVFDGDFEQGIGGWSADNGLWEVGSPTLGPAYCFLGSSCAGTVLGGNYSASTDSRFIGPTINIPTVTNGQRLRLRYYQWFAFAAYDIGYVQLSQWDESSGQWSDWSTIAESIADTSPAWSLNAVDISKYMGKKIRLGFYHTAKRDCCHASESYGWYIDNIAIEPYYPKLFSDFESDTEQWSATRGVWQIGTPTTGPQGCFSGTKCAGTILDNNYPPYTDSRLVSSPILLSAISNEQELRLRFYQWFSYASLDVGYVQISLWDESLGEWQPWESIGTAVTSTSNNWTVKDVDITSYAGHQVRFAFYHTATRDCCHASEGAGWYIDNISLVNVDLGNSNPPIIPEGQEFNVPENSANGSVFGLVVAEDGDAGTLFSDFSLVNDGNTPFKINPDTGQLIVSDQSKLDFEAGPQQYTVSVTVSDGQNISAPQTILIKVINVVEAPVIPAGQVYFIDENSPNGTIVGKIGVTELNQGASKLQYNLDSDAFAVDNDTGEIKVIDSSLLDYETIPVFSLKISVTDRGQTSVPQVITIKLNNVQDEFPGVRNTTPSGSPAKPSGSHNGIGSFDLYWNLVMMFMLLYKARLTRFCRKIA